jgi:ribosomal protein S8
MSHYITIDLEDYIDEFTDMVMSAKYIRKDLLDALKKEGYIPSNSLNDTKDETNINLNKLVDNYWKLTIEEEDVIRKMADRF